MDVEIVSDQALLVHIADSMGLEESRRTLSAAMALRRAELRHVADVIPAYNSVLVRFDPVRTDWRELRLQVARALGALALPVPEGRAVEVPVCYGGEYGPDLAELAEAKGLTEEAVISLHTGADYLVSFLGFLPGFPYLTGLPRELITPRLAVPRTRVPAGSVAIGGAQTGIYPKESPGGWRIIGRTPMEIFSGLREPAAAFRAGDVIRFRRMDPGGSAR